MASLYIKDDETAALVTRLAKRSGLTKTALVRELATAREAELDRVTPRPSVLEVLEKLWRDHPGLLQRTGLEADKAFYDSLNDEDED
uniref:type II toxin-antitoxin system VapB family antitoxin n=1 Tax=uncultured Sphingomonas sp. TaxID=158754 RepID=UPI0035CA76CC